MDLNVQDLFVDWQIDKTKKCFKCGQDKPHNKTNFALGKSKRHGATTNLMAICKDCKKTMSNETLAIKKNHQVPPIGTKCAICNRTDLKLVCDHKSGTKTLRGWICGGCNKMLGFAKDNIETLESAVRYLKE